MSDLDTGAIPASSGASSGASGTGGRAANAAPSVSQGAHAYDDVTQIAQTNRGMAAADDAAAGDDEDQDHAAGDGWPDEGAEDADAEPVDELAQWQQRAKEYEERNKGYAARLQREVEANRQLQARLQQAAYQQATQQITPAEQQFQADWHRFEAARDYMTADQAEAAYGQLQGRARVLQQARQLRERELQLAAREAQQAPQKRASDLKGLQAGYQHHYGVEIPDEVVGHARTWDEAIKAAYGYARGVLATRDGARAQVNGSGSGGAATKQAAAPGVRGNRTPSQFGNKVGPELLKDYFDKQRRQLQRQS